MLGLVVRNRSSVIWSPIVHFSFVLSLVLIGVLIEARTCKSNGDDRISLFRRAFSMFRGELRIVIGAN